MTMNLTLHNAPDFYNQGYPGYREREPSVVRGSFVDWSSRALGIVYSP